MPLIVDARRRRTGFHCGRPPRNKGLQYRADPPTVEKIVAVMRGAGDQHHGLGSRALIVLLWRAGLRISEALSLAAGQTGGCVGICLLREVTAEGARPFGEVNHEVLMILRIEEHPDPIVGHRCLGLPETQSALPFEADLIDRFNANPGLEGDLVVPRGLIAGTHAEPTFAHLKDNRYCRSTMGLKILAALPRGPA
jgi:hypothetical protein